MPALEPAPAHRALQVATNRLLARARASHVPLADIVPAQVQPALVLALPVRVANIMAAPEPAPARLVLPVATNRLLARARALHVPLADIVL
jgi:hypothetical protein